MKKIALDLKVEASLVELKGKIAALPRVKDGKIYKVPEDLQKRAIAIFQGCGLKYEEFGQRIGISGTTIRTWMERQEKKKKKVGRPKKVKFSQVKVRPEVQPLERKALTLELSSGAKVHGLSLVEVRELIATDGGAR